MDAFISEIELVLEQDTVLRPSAEGAMRRTGRVVMSGAAKEIAGNADVRRAYLGI
ncbi:MAG: hypothetical protein NVSMB26_11070 [Beijerinckiaceae bacterium]